MGRVNDTENELVGVASFVFKECNDGNPTVYTSIAHYYHWIEETIKTETELIISNTEYNGVYPTVYDLNQWIPTQLHIKALDVCGKKKITLGLPSEHVFHYRYTCWEDELYVAWWKGNDSDCSDKPDVGPEEVGNIGTDVELVCDGHWNSSYAVVREYLTSDTECSEDIHSWWNDEAYIVDVCQPLGDENQNVSTKLVCDDTTGITQHIYYSKDCSTDLESTITLIEADSCSEGKDGIWRHFEGCFNRENETQPQPTPTTTASPKKDNSKEKDAWMVTGIVFIVLFVVALVTGIILYRRMKEANTKDGYQQTGTTDNGNTSTEMYHD